MIRVEYKGRRGNEKKKKEGGVKSAALDKPEFSSVKLARGFGVAGGGYSRD
jgi:hypothetical protein